MENIYQRLQERFNEQSFGYCATEDGCELVMLKRFFSEEDAEHYLAMPIDHFFDVKEFAPLIGVDEEKATEILEDMSHRGLLYRVRREDKTTFHTAPAAHGLYEFNINHLEPEWLGNGLFKHFGEGLLPMCYDAGVPFYRSVPINADVVEAGQILPIDNIIEQIKKHSPICVSPCACRTATQLCGVPDCGHSKRTCIQTGDMAKFYLENELLAEEISQQEAIDIINESVEAGMVIQTCFSKESEIICSCSLDCCGILQAAKAFPGDAMNNITHYRIQHSADTCTGCGVCVEKCPMKSISLNEAGQAVTDASCVGCGNCVTVCPEHARVLVLKGADEIEPLPETLFDAYSVMEDRRRAKGAL